MHYEINTIEPNTGELINSYRRAGNEPGKAQAFVLARQTYKKDPTKHIYVNEVIGQNKRKTIAVAGFKPEDDEVQVLTANRIGTLQRFYDQAIKKLMQSGMTKEEAFTELDSELRNNYSDDE